MEIANVTEKIVQLLDLIDSLPNKDHDTSGVGIVDVRIEEVTNNG